MRAPWFCDGPWRGLPKGLTFHQSPSTSSPKRPKITVDVIIAKIRLGKTTSYRWVSATQLSRADHKIYSCTIILDFDLKSLQMRRDMPDTRFKKVYTFNSARKSMSTIIPLDTGGFRWHTHECKKTCVKLFPLPGCTRKGRQRLWWRNAVSCCLRMAGLTASPPITRTGGDTLFMLLSETFSVTAPFYKSLSVS